MKIMIFTKNWLGDILFEFPAIAEIRKRFPDAEIVCLAPKRCLEVLERNPDVSRVILFDERNEHAGLLAKWKLIRNLRREVWDQAYLFHRSRTRAFLALLAGARERIGYAAGRKQLLTTAVPESSVPLHHVDYFLELLERAGFHLSGQRQYRFIPSESDRLDAAALRAQHGLQDYICFHLGANWVPKRWPVRHFARLADLLTEEYGLTIAVTGSGEDIRLFEEMKSNVKKAVLVPLIGKTSVGQLSALYEKAALVVSADSGPMHFAAAVGAPLTAIFGPTNPDLTGPRGQKDSLIVSYVPAGYRSPWVGDDLPAGGWMEHIRPEQVMEEISKKGWLAHRKAGSRGRYWDGGTFSRVLPAQPARNGTINILVITLSNIGDVVLTTPVFSALKARFPHSILTVVCSPRAAGILQGSRLIDRIVHYDKQVSWKSKFGMIKSLRSVRYDWVVDLRNTAIPFMVRARRRSPILGRPSRISFRERHLAILEKMRIKPEVIPPFDFFSEKEEATVRQKIARAAGTLKSDSWILVAPRAASELKTWRMEGFSEVIRNLLEETEDPILLIGDESQKLLIEPLTEINSKRVLNFSGLTTLRELAALIAHASLLVTNDSAVMHLGYELNSPVAAIFGPTHHLKYGRTGPKFRIIREEELPCSPCESPRCRFARQACMEDLETRKVMDACRELLSVGRLKKTAESAIVPG